MTQPMPLRMPGATLMTRLKVYDTPTPDGQIGGTPHVHLVCTEMYVVLSGSGAVEIIDKDGFSRVEIHQHDALVFSPGTIHRLLNPNRDLEILVMMENNGLPERGDNVVTFTDSWLENDASYAQAMHIESLAEAYQRRDRGVEGFLQLKAAFASGHEQGLLKLKHFYVLAQARTMPRLDEWQNLVEQGAVQAAHNALMQIQSLKQKTTAYLLNNEIACVKADESAKPGFCGHLYRYFDPATLHPEGQALS